MVIGDRRSELHGPGKKAKEAKQRNPVIRRGWVGQRRNMFFVAF